jgi:hypothetical protein
LYSFGQAANLLTAGDTVIGQVAKLLYSETGNNPSQKKTEHCSDTEVINKKSGRKKCKNIQQQVFANGHPLNY